MKKIRNLIKNECAVSGLTTMVVMLVVSVSVFSGTTAYITNDSGPEKTPSVELVGKMMGDELVIVHSQGSQLRIDRFCELNIGGNVEYIRIADLLDEKSKENGYWDIGERLVYDLGDISHFHVSFQIVNEGKKDMLYDETIQEGEITKYRYLAKSLGPTNILTNSANFNSLYNLRDKSGNIRFSYKKLGGNWINTSWEPISGAGFYNKTINGLMPTDIYVYKVQIDCESNIINGARKVFIQGGATYVKPFTSFEFNSSHKTVTADGSSLLDNVALWYRFSKDNKTWGVNWWHSSWKCRKLITIDPSKVEADLYSFPMLFYLDVDNNLSENALNNGDDIAFILYSDNETQLNHEIEVYDNTTGKLVAWVNLPKISSSEETKIWLYYGNPSSNNLENPSDVWDSNFRTVLHLNEAPNDMVQGHFDSSKNNNHGIPNNFQDGGGGSTDVAGKMGGGVYFGGDDDWIEIPHSNSLISKDNELSLSAWVKLTTNPNSDAGVIVKSDGSNYNIHLGVQNDRKANFQVLTEKELSDLSSAATLEVNQWYYLYGIYNGITSKVYINKFEAGSKTINGLIESPSAPLLIGRCALGDNRFFKGIIDEVRVSYEARSVDWFNTEYNNQNSPLTFYKIGDEEEYSSDWTFWDDPSNPDTSYPWEWEFDLVDGQGFYQFYTIGSYEGAEETKPPDADVKSSYKDESAMAMMG